MGPFKVHPPLVHISFDLLLRNSHGENREVKMVKEVEKVKRRKKTTEKARGSVPQEKEEKKSRTEAVFFILLFPTPAVRKRKERFFYLKPMTQKTSFRLEIIRALMSPSYFRPLEQKQACVSLPKYDGNIGTKRWFLRRRVRLEVTEYGLAFGQ